MNPRRTVLVAALTAVLVAIVTSSAVHAQSANDALRALKGLGAAVTVGVNLEEYRRRLIDAKVIVDDYAQRKAVSLAEAKAKHALVTAMGDFNLANAIWAGRVQRGGSGVGLRTFDMLKERLKDVECAPLKTLVDAVLKDYEQDEGQTRLSIVVYGPASDRVLPALWSCAMDKIAEAERLLGPR